MADIALGTDILIIVAFSFVLGFLAIKAKEPVIIGYLIAGIIAGSSVLNLIQNQAIIEVLAQIGIALMLFHVGIEFSFHSFKRKRSLAIGGALLQIALTSIVLFLLFNFGGVFIKADGYTLLFMAVVFALSSTAVVVKMLADERNVNVSASKIMTSWLIIQDLAAIPISIILLSVGKGSGNLFLDVGLALIKGVLILALALGVFKKLIQKGFDLVAAQQSRELLMLTSLAYVLGLSFLTQQLGVSFVLGAFVAGLTLSGTSFYTRIYTEIRSLKGIFTLLFFFSIGALLNVKDIWQNLIPIIGLVLVVIVVKFVTTIVAAKIFRAHTKTALNIGLGIFQIGEFSFVIGKLAVDQNLIAEKTYSIILAAAIISIILTPVLIFRGNIIYDFLREFTRKRWRFIYEKLFLESIDTKEDFHGLENHVVVCGYGRVGSAVVDALRASNVDIVVIEESENLVTELKKEGVHAIFGDSADIEVLEKADTEKAHAIVVAVPTLVEVVATAESAKMLNEKIYVIARSHDAKSAERLKEIGADMIIEPEFETAKRIVTEVLPALGKGYKRRVKEMEESSVNEVEAVIEEEIKEEKETKNYQKK